MFPESGSAGVDVPGGAWWTGVPRVGVPGRHGLSYHYQHQIQYYMGQGLGARARGLIVPGLVVLALLIMPVSPSLETAFRDRHIWSSDI